ncbi:MAG: HNH endonuclease [Pseudomonadota bacterium]
MKSVFDTKPNSGYDDDISQKYQFPKRYLSIAENSLDDWVVFRRPRADGGNLAYFATARVAKIEPDLSAPGMFYAYLQNFLEFENVVPWNDNGQYAEQALRDIPKAEVGVFMRGRSVRPLEENDFNRMIAVGLPTYWDEIPNTELALKADRPRRVEQVLTNRVIRDRDFRRRICLAYNNRCAVTGFRMSDEDGNFEVQAAHIWPVAEGGPDTTQNGLALSSTAHWLFDRHLISISSDYRLLIREELLPADVKKVVKSPGEAIGLPKTEADRPSLKYIAKHRAKFEAKKQPTII